MFRVILAFVTILSTAICIAAVLAWLVQPRWQYIHHSSDNQDTISLELQEDVVLYASSHDASGMLAAIATRSAGTSSRSPWTVLEDFKLSPRVRVDFAGVRWSELDLAEVLQLPKSWGSSPMPFRSLSVTFPAIATVSAILPLVWLMRRFGHRRHAGKGGFPVIGSVKK